MYAVIDAGGKQERVEVGQLVDVDLLRAGPGDELTLEALLVVDGQHVAATPEALAGATVSARVVGEALGPKIDGFTYKSKTRSRRRYGHRQRYTTIEIVAIEAGEHVARAPEPEDEVVEVEVAEVEVPEVEAREAEVVEADEVEAEVVEAEAEAGSQKTEAEAAEAGAADGAGAAEADETDELEAAARAAAEAAGDDGDAS